MAAVSQSVRPNLASAGADSVLNVAEVASLLGYKPETAQKWIVKHQSRLRAWKTGEVAGQWRVQMGSFRQACKQLGIKSVKAITTLLCLTLMSCAGQTVTTPQGMVAKNNQLFSKGGVSATSDGTLTMWSDSTEASGHLGKFADALLRFSLWKVGIETAGQAAEVITDAVAQ